MERAGIEEGLLVEEKTNDKYGGIGAAVAMISYPVTAVAVFSTAVAVCGAFTNGCAVGYSSPAESGIMDDLGLSVAEEPAFYSSGDKGLWNWTVVYSVFGSILTIGGIVGAVICGKITDLFGRRGTMWFSDIFCLMGWLAIALAKDYWWLDLGRLSIGFGIGLICYVVPVYIAEIMPKNIRGGFTSANTVNKQNMDLDQRTNQMLICFCVANSAVDDMLWLFTDFFVGTVVSWRILAVIGAIPCILQVIGLFFIPESPRWLVSKGWPRGKVGSCSTEAKRKNADISQEAAEIREYTEAFQQLSEARILDLFQRRYAHSLIVGVGLMVLQQFGGSNAILYYASSIFESAGFSTTFGTRAMAILQVLNSYFNHDLNMGLGFMLFLDMYRYYFADSSDIFGFCSWDVLGLFGCSIVILIAGPATDEGVNSNFRTYWRIGLPWVVMSEIFPINIKGSAGSLVASSNLFCSWITTYTFNFVFAWSSAGTFFLFSIICSATVLFVAKLLPEPRAKARRNTSNNNPFS
ncbi:Sugar transporter ERD6-like 5 [Vitis vinifera]|uniref:Sugar transporter ERD6-like 5 n=1 Tax=Vitis vinifera TaxID=29760 RepID=A0A438KBY5_VITVI|nr:Sugar transporter ERD6-like 5 [Vitis vinifera]